MQQLDAIRRSQRQKGNASQLNLFGMFVFSALGLGILNLLLLLGLFVSMNRLSQKAPPSLVQTVDGRSLVTNAMESKERTPIVIRRFTIDTLTMLLSASGKLPPTADKPNVQTIDAGIAIRLPNQTERKVSTSTWQSSFALSEDFRASALQGISELMVPEAFTGQAQVVLIPQTLSEPEKIGEGQWKVNMIANLVTIAAGNPQGITIPFNKEIFLRAVDTPPPSDVSTPLQKAIYQVRSSGIEIYGMRDYSPGNMKK
jgi:hypothetical protein